MTISLHLHDVRDHDRIRQRLAADTDDLAGFHAESGCGKQAFSATSARDAVEQVARILGIDFRDVFFARQGNASTYVIRRRV